MSPAGGEEPAAGVPDLHWIAARLRLAAGDVDAHLQLLVHVLVTVLPRDLAVVVRRRSAADRLLRRPGQITAIEVRSADQLLRLVRRPHGHGWTAERSHVVLGVTLSTASVTPSTWTEEVASLLHERADEDERAAEAVRRFLGAL